MSEVFVASVQHQRPEKAHINACVKSPFAHEREMKDGPRLRYNQHEYLSAYFEQTSSAHRNPHCAPIVTNRLRLAA